MIQKTIETPKTGARLETGKELNSVTSKSETGRNKSKSVIPILQKSLPKSEPHSNLSTSKLTDTPKSEPRSKATAKLSAMPKSEPKFKSSTPKFNSSLKFIETVGTKRKSTGSDGNCKQSKILKLSDENENLKFVIKLAKQDVWESKDQKMLKAKFEDYKTRLLSQFGGNLKPENSTLEERLSGLNLQILNLERDFKNLKKSNRQCKKEDWSHLTPAAINEKKRKVLELIHLNV